MNAAGRDQIQGWREIAAALGRDERTAKRWEKRRGLPVRRIPGGGRANVYLLRAELEAWLAGATPVPGWSLPAGTDVGLPAGAGAGLPAQRGVGVAAEVSAAGPGADSERVATREDPRCEVRAGELSARDGDAGPGAAVAGGGAGDGGEGVRAPVTAEDSGKGRSGEDATTARDAGLPVPAGEERRQWREVVFGLLAVAAVLFVIVEATFDRSRDWDAATLEAEAARGAAEAAAGASRMPDGPSLALRSEADRITLEGVYLAEQRSPESLAAATATFEDAIAKDAEFAPAYSGLAVTYLLEREYATMPHEEAYRRASEAAGRALSLDPKLAEAHAVMGFVDFFSRWRAGDAAREFETAIRLDPNCAVAHHWYGSMLMHQGRWAEAVAELDRAQHLAPASSAILATKALALGYGGDRAEGVRLLESLERVDPWAGAPHRNLAFLSLVEPRDLPRYLREMQRFAELRREPEAMRVLSGVTIAFRRGGEPAMWAETLAAERALHPDAAHPTLLMAEAEAALGQTDEALGHLSRLAEERASPMIGLVADPVLRPLHADPRFRRIAGAVGLAMPAGEAAPGRRAPLGAEHRLAASVQEPGR